MLARGSSSNGRAPDSHSGGSGINARLLQRFALKETNICFKIACRLKEEKM